MRRKTSCGKFASPISEKIEETRAFSSVCLNKSESICFKQKSKREKLTLIDFL